MTPPLTSHVDRSSSGPRVSEEDESPGLERGVFMLSLDTELAWGSVPDGLWRGRSWMFERTRDVSRRLLALCARYDIKATWAVVGHLMLRGCEAQQGVKHPEFLRPTFDWFEGDWLKDDPCADADSAPLWYAPDLIEEILRCSTSQEIGCHGFAHVPAGMEGCTRECFESDLEAAIEAARSWGVELRSYVYPMNSIGHVSALASHGFTAYRGDVPLPRWCSPGRRPARRAVRAMQWSLPVGPLTVEPMRTGGIWNLAASTFYYHRSGVGKLLPIGARVHRAGRGIHEAIRKRSIFHLYLHPFNLTTDPDGLLGGLARIFRVVQKECHSERLDNLTMGECARLLDRHKRSGSDQTAER